MNRHLPNFKTLRVSLLAFTVLALILVPLADAQEATTLEMPAAESQVAPAEVVSEETAEQAPTAIENIAQITGTSIELTAIPPRLGDDGSLAGDPGATIQAEVRVRNNSNETITVDTLVEDFIIGEDGVTPVAVQEQPNSLWSLASWIQLGSTRNTVGPFASATIPVVIQVPDNALPGGRYAMIMHQPVASNDEQVTGEVAGKSAINQRVGTLVYFRVNGDIKESATIRNIRIPFLTEFGPVAMAFDLENMSDIHIRPSTTVTIKNMLGQTSEVIEVESKNVFPYTTRTFETQWDRTWGFGRYTAFIDAAYGEQGKIAQATMSFWLIPYKLIIAVILVVVALIGMVVALRRYIRNRNSVENQHITLLEDRIQQLEQELQRKR